MPVVNNFKLLHLAVWHSQMYQFQLMNAGLVYVKKMLALQKYYFLFFSVVWSSFIVLSVAY